MISSYRLGDLVLLKLNASEENELLNDYPNSFGSEYIREKRKNPSVDNIELITKIVTQNIERYLKVLPKNIEESTVIHIRLGDVIAGHTWHEQSKRPLIPSNIKSLLTNDTNPKYVIGKCFFAKTSSNNYEECIQLSNEYLKCTLDTLQAQHFSSENADIDLCCAIKSKQFVQGRGFFSKLIVEIRNKLNVPSIKTETMI